MYNGGQLLSLICSTVATFVLAAKPDHFFGLNLGIAPLALSGIAAAALGIPKQVDAERKWRANRYTRTESEIFCCYLTDENFDIPRAFDWLAAIQRQHEILLMGKENATRSVD